MSFEDVKNHVKRHKTVYTIAGTTVVVAGITYVIMRGRHAEVQSALDGSETITVRPFSLTFFSKESGNVVTSIQREGRGSAGYITRCMETGELFGTQGDAAKAFGLSAANLSSHLNGKFPDCGGYHFERVGVLT